MSYRIGSAILVPLKYCTHPLTFIVGHPAGHDGLAVLPPPEDLGLGVSPGLAGQVHPLLLPDHQVIGAPAVNNRRGN